MPVTHKSEFERIFGILKKHGKGLLEKQGVYDQYKYWVGWKKAIVKIEFDGPQATYISIFRCSDLLEYDLHDNGFAYGPSLARYSPHILTLINEHSFLNPMVYLRILELVSAR